jgi:pyruvyl transferase EpsI
MLRYIKSIIPLRWKREALRAVSPFRPPADFPDDRPRLIIALAADYGNLGDVALTRALVRFADHHLPSHRPYLLCAGRVFRDLRGVARATDQDDVVAIVGGGNMGDIYPDLEEARCLTARVFKRQRVVSFPQSVEFSDTRAGRCALTRSRLAYESHPRLEIFAREAESHRRMRSMFPNCRVSLVPDTVLSLDPPPIGARDIPLLVCFRQDLESGISERRRSAILSTLCADWPGLVMTDTTVPGARLDFPAYDRLLDEKIEMFARARCVVTDRLHGLIFSFITRTPCVVLENSNHKIRSTVETWLSGSAGLRLLSDPEAPEVVKAVRETLAAQPRQVDFTAAFAPLVSSLRKCSPSNS